MSNYLASNTDLESVANAIRTKGGTSAQLAFPSDFVSAINAIPTGGGTTNYVMEYIKAISNNEFKDAPLGEVLNFKRVTSCGEHGCQNLQGTKIIVFPTLSSAGKYIVSDCTSLEKYDLNLAQTALENYFFSSDQSLTTIILRKNGVHSIGAAGFNDTPFASGGAGGTLYVPSSLISSYQSASNWSTMLARAQNSIQAIEGSQYENYYADGTPITS